MAVLTSVLMLVMTQHGAAADWEIVPGLRIGPIRLGMPMTQLVTILGMPSNPPSVSEQSWRYRSGGLFVSLDDSGHVKIITIFGKFTRKGEENELTIETNQGIHIGSEVSELFRKMGEPKMVTGSGVYYCGINFLTFDQRIVQIEVDRLFCPKSFTSPVPSQPNAFFL